MNKHTARRKRRREKQKINGGIGAVRKHARKGGRTGQVWSKRTSGKASHYTSRRPNPPPLIEPLGGPLF